MRGKNKTTEFLHKKILFLWNTCIRFLEITHLSSAYRAFRLEIMSSNFSRDDAEPTKSQNNPSVTSAAADADVVGKTLEKNILLSEDATFIPQTIRHVFKPHKWNVHVSHCSERRFYVLKRSTFCG